MLNALVSMFCFPIVAKTQLHLVDCKENFFSTAENVTFPWVFSKASVTLWEKYGMEYLISNFKS